MTSLVVLGIDAAWTSAQPSGVALIRYRAPSWNVVAAAPSYESFFALEEGTPVDWKSTRFAGCTPDASRLLDVSRRLAGKPVHVIAVDMPIARQPITGRRAADNAISRQFGTRGCSTHSPSAERPGMMSHQFTHALESLGYEVATTKTMLGTKRRVLEVYPHPALLTLLGRDYRVPYKVSHYRKYHPGKSAAECRVSVTRELFFIRRALQKQLGRTQVPLPKPLDVRSAASLKPFEDALDAIVCAWVGARYLIGEAEAYGDDSSAVWCPKEEQKGP